MQSNLSEADMALIHALQVRPRASWTLLSGVLGESAQTLAGRWARLRGQGISWITGYPKVDHTGSVAIVEVDIAPGMLDAVCARLDHDPRVVSIEHAAHGRDLVLTVYGTDFAELSATLLDDLTRLPGIVATRAHISAAFFVEGASWQLDALDPGQRAALLVGVPTTPGPPVDLGHPTYAPLVDVLALDGRASATQLARATGRPESTVRRQLARLLRSGRLRFRCEVAQMWTAWPVSATWWCRVPANAQAGLVEAVRREPRVRLCMSVTGPENILIGMWTASVADVMRMRAWLETHLGGGMIADTAVVLRTRKRIAWMLHPDGRCTGEVHPLNLAVHATRT
ncbi:Lrp/AsnC family transcriptional regulator [Pseudonocardia sp. TRM90224]|uniref:Lrp/AsnC family transcriptional regulator n=1 Tax=Pseudonocardia sp. TRM90224 TaxID=2812678 RepID=UPI001E3B2F3B|nr:Lrp/AsnC family transcriptional regulator [Pseudonocardia sp. TRM90224]